MNITKLMSLREEVQECTKCRLHKVRSNPVFGTGNINDPLIAFMEDSPGMKEDLEGLPFQGYSGKRLDTWIAHLGLKREEVYLLTNVACRTPSNRYPLPDERRSCAPYTTSQLEIVNPKVIVCLGMISAWGLLGLRNNTYEMGINQLRDKWWDWHGIPVRVTYTPNHINKKNSDLYKVLEDLNVVKRYLLINKL